MKILVFAHRLEIGGTQVNAIELAAALRDLHGFDVVLFATPGPMEELVHEKGLRFLPAPDARIHPSIARMRALHDAVRAERPDLIHVWDWWQCLDAFYWAHLMMRIPMAVTDMSMGVTRFLPKSLPTTFGTPQLLDKACSAGRSPLQLIVPPVDVHRNAPGSVSTHAFRQQYGLNDGEIVLVTVSRLVESLKAESLRRTIAAVRSLGRDLPVRLLVVGDGGLRPELEHLAALTSVELGRSAVVLTGALIDPRPAYAVADIVIGMGGSALRGMAFAKPVVIVGENGFSVTLTRETADRIYYDGMYGRGEGDPGNAMLADRIRALAERLDQLPALGEFSREFVLEYFSLEAVSGHLARFCRAAATGVPRFPIGMADGLRTASVYAAQKLRWSLQQQLAKRRNREPGARQAA